MSLLPDIINKFGVSAGKIWRVLNEKGTLDEKLLMKNTRLKEHDFYAAVGWLARENKIRKINEKYELSETNLTSKIGGDAGLIWNTLASTGETDISFMVKKTGMQERDTFSALGWLARENKIKSKKKRVKGAVIKFLLKQ